MRRGFLGDHSAQVLFTHIPILWRVTRNEWAARYAGSILGVGWVIVLPLALIGIYAAVYLLIFRVQVPGMTSVHYVFYVFAGLTPFLMMSEALALGVTSVVANKFVLTSGVFPIDLIPPKAVLSSQGTMVVGFAVIVLAGLATGTLTWTVFFLPVLWVLYLMALIGLTWILSLVNIVFRDLPNLVGLVLMMTMIASPIAYTPEMVPPALQPLLVINPFAYFATAFQDLLVRGRVPALWHSAILIVISVGLFLLGGWFFGRAKRILIDYV